MKIWSKFEYILTGFGPLVYVYLWYAWSECSHFLVWRTGWYLLTWRLLRVDLDVEEVHPWHISRIAFAVLNCPRLKLYIESTFFGRKNRDDQSKLVLFEKSFLIYWVEWGNRNRYFILEEVIVLCLIVIKF